VPPVMLVTGSSEVYGRPAAEDLPLREVAPLLPVAEYGISKLGQEAVAVELAQAHGIRLVVTRAFNHIGPGQRREFVVPALAGRIVDVLQGRARTIPVGNVDVRRDFLDVRDVVRAYRRLLEVAAMLPAHEPPVVANVASGNAASIRWIADTLRRVARCDADLEVDAALVRPDDPPKIVGDATLLRRLTGWAPRIPLEQTLAEVLEEVRRRDAGPPGA
jgi:GDP-4-dehydro-6-deoxy-D-mannose reductase